MTVASAPAEASAWQSAVAWFQYSLIRAVPYLGAATGLAALCWYFGGILALKAGLPLLGAAVLCGTLASTLHVHPLRPRWLASRRVRVLRDLEYALADYNMATEPEQRAAYAMSHLRSARARAGSGALGQRIELAVQRVEQAATPIADELRACIREALPASRTARRPYARTTEISLVKVLVEGLLLSLMVVVFIKTRHPVHVAGLVELPVQLFLAHTLVRLISRIEVKRRTHRAHAGFRVLFVTDQYPLTAINREALRAYARVGEVIAIYCSDEDRRGVERYIPGVSGELYFVDRVSAHGIIDAYAPNADLLVVNTRDESIARHLVQDTSLPERCRLSIDEDGYAPAGFLWVNPIRLVLDSPRYTSAIDDPLDPAAVFNLGISWRGLGSGDYLFGIAFVAGLALWCFDGWRPLGTLLVVSGVAGELPRLFGARRRANVSATTLRVPRSMKWSLRLRQLKRIEFWLSLLLGLITVAAAGYAAWTVFHWTERLWMLWLVVAGISLAPVLIGLVEGLLLLLKWYCDWGFRIVIFRRNSVSFGYEHKLTVMGGCGAFGQVVVVQDRSIEKTDENYGEWRESSLGSWFGVLTEVREMLRPNLFLQSWKRQVLAELDRADFAVFDWAQEITPNMAWELRIAAARLPAHRILLVVNAEHGAEAKALADALAPHDGTEPISPLVQSREPDDQYAWPSNREFKERFANQLVAMMSRLEVEPRPVSDVPDDIRLEAIAAWAPPASPSP